MASTAYVPTSTRPTGPATSRSHVAAPSAQTRDSLLGQAVLWTGPVLAFLALVLLTPGR